MSGVAKDDVIPWCPMLESVVHPGSFVTYQTEDGARIGEVIGHNEVKGLILVPYVPIEEISFFEHTPMIAGGFAADIPEVVQRESLAYASPPIS